MSRENLKLVFWAILILAIAGVFIAANLYAAERYHQHLHNKMEANHGR